VGGTLRDYAGDLYGRFLERLNIGAREASNAETHQALASDENLAGSSQSAIVLAANEETKNLEVEAGSSAHSTSNANQVDGTPEVAEGNENKEEEESRSQ
jgi:hypothetical protein